MNLAPSSTKSSTANRATIAAIPVLSIMLVVILYGNFRPNTVEPPATPRPLGSAQAAAQSPAVPAHTTPTARVWPSFALHEIIALDPFPAPERPPVTPAEAARPAPQPNGLTLSDSLHDPVMATRASVADSIQAIYFDGTRAAALLGSRVVRIGDVLEDGTTVIDVGAEGIVVQTTDEATETMPLPTDNPTTTDN